MMLLLFAGAGVAAGNAAPVVSAGSDANCTTGTPFGLSGSVTDDGLPSATLTSLWTQTSGPGVSVFSNATSPTSTVTCPVAGTYVLRLTGDDTALTAFDEMTLTVSNPPGGSAADGWEYPQVRINWM